MDPKQPSSTGFRRDLVRLYGMGAVLLILLFGGGTLAFLNSMARKGPGLLRRLTLPHEAQLGSLRIAVGPKYVLEPVGQEIRVHRLLPAFTPDQLSTALKFRIGSMPSDTSKWVRQESACIPKKANCRVRRTAVRGLEIRCYETAGSQRLESSSGLVGAPVALSVSLRRPFTRARVETVRSSIAWHC
jgi:hypothetical protein